MATASAGLPLTCMKAKGACCARCSRSGSPWRLHQLACPAGPLPLPALQCPPLPPLVVTAGCC
eukprot:1160586-Pelagomonas_calceolata.AAC.3